MTRHNFENTIKSNIFENHSKLQMIISFDLDVLKYCRDAQTILLIKETFTRTYIPEIDHILMTRHDFESTIKSNIFENHSKLQIITSFDLIIIEYSRDAQTILLIKETFTHTYIPEIDHILMTCHLTFFLDDI